MANVFANPSHVAQLGYSGFDMGNVLKFSSTTGELLPVYYDILQPGDKVDCNVMLKTRTLPLETAAMVNLTEHVDWFFVPLEQIYTFFGSWYYGVDDIHTSFFKQDSKMGDSLPFVSLNSLNLLIRDVATQDDGYFSRARWGFSNIGSSLRLMEMLGVPYRENPNDSTIAEAGASMSICPILFAAYQKIYFDYYRLADREAGKPYAYNLDRYYNLSNASMADQVAETELFKLRFRPARKDFFTSVYVSPLMGSNSVGSAPILGQNSDLWQSFHNWLSPGSFSTYRISDGGSAVAADKQPTYVAPSTVNANSVLAAHLSPHNIRTSFAIQKLLEVTRRSGKTYDAQTLAHFGVDVPTGIDGNVRYLGSQDSQVAIGDVISTADTTNTDGGSPLGQVAGKGYGVGSGRA